MSSGRSWYVSTHVGVSMVAAEMAGGRAAAVVGLWGSGDEVCGLAGGWIGWLMDEGCGVG